MAWNCILDDLSPIKLLFLYFRLYNMRFTYRLTLPRALGKGAVSSLGLFPYNWSWILELQVDNHFDEMHAQYMGITVKQILTIHTQAMVVFWGLIE